MKIEFTEEAQSAFERVVAGIPTGYTIGVVLEGQSFDASASMVGGQDVRLGRVEGDRLVVHDLDDDGEPIGEERTIDLGVVDEIHVY
jgi:hypothetical protein